ncbi:MAG: lipoyl(octanoyl) transferase LipB [Pseudomonadota bacterium]
MIIKHLGQQDFFTTWQAMHDFTVNRDENTPDELWVLEHPPVFTQGQAGKPEHILNPHNIPVIATDRGGQVTYHGPGQIIVYVLFDLKRAKMGIRSLVSKLEQAIIQLLAKHNITAESFCDRPGVYISGEKIASIGLRVKRGCTFHGIAFNVDMDLTPFTYINPCGFSQLKMTQLKNFLPHLNIDQIALELADEIQKQLHLMPSPEIIKPLPNTCGEQSGS